MLDENLPTFLHKTSSDTPTSSVLFFTQNGSDPAPEYVFRRADAATNPASRSKYAAALTDPYSADVVYAETVVEPEWQQPTLSAAEIRAQNGVAAAPVPVVPDSFTMQLYNPDQTIAFRMVPGSWGKTDTWEFEMPTQSFRPPSASQVDRAVSDGAVRDITPKIMFKWKKDGRLSKDMTCYMVGKSLGKHKSKEPDITVALFKQGRESAITIYEPNLQRVEVEDRKGLDIVILLGSEVIKDLYLAPRPDTFNITGAAAAAAAGAGGAPTSGRKNSRPIVAAAAAVPPKTHSPPLAMSGANNAPPPSGRPGNAPVTAAAAVAVGGGPAAPPPSAAIDAETKRLKAMVEKEERERERRDLEEQKRIKKMLEAEEKEQRKREAEIAKETERLRKKYGVEGQQLPARPATQPPVLPPRHPQPYHNHHQPPPPPVAGGFAPQPGPYLGPPGGQAGWYGGPPPPQRPLSAGPAPGPFNNPTFNSWWHGPAGAGPQPMMMTPPPVAGPQQQPPRKPRSGSGPYAPNNAASSSGFFHRSDDDRRRVQKKRSVHF